MSPELVEAVRAHVAAAAGLPCVVDSVRRVPGGACQDNFAVDLRLDGRPHRCVLRSDARTALSGSLPRSTEFVIIAAAREQGVPTPAARWSSVGLLRADASAYFVDWVDGVAIGARVVRGAALASARERLPEQLASALAAIHRVTPASGLVIPGVDPTGPLVERRLDEQRRALRALREPHPALELALRWLGDHAPADRPPVLVHGDYRVGNFLVDESGLRAVLDWEFAHWGSPLEDVGWLCVRDWRFGRPGLPVGGICARQRFYDAYGRAAGVEVDPAEVHWWEVCGNLRWAIGAVEQGARFLSGAESDIELLAIGRRVAEMEFEALRLIERGPEV